jgi:hypothetical protein
MLRLRHPPTSTGPSRNSQRDAAEPRTPLFVWLASPAPLVLGMAGGGMPAALSIAVGIVAPCLAAVATYRLRYSYAPSLCLALLFVAAVGLLCFNSAAFVVDTWTTLLLAITTIPRSRSTVASVAAASDGHADEG